MRNAAPVTLFLVGLAAAADAQTPGVFLGVTFGLILYGP